MNSPSPRSSETRAHADTDSPERESEEIVALPVEVVRSRRRRKTVEAHMVDGVIPRLGAGRDEQGR